MIKTQIGIPRLYLTTAALASQAIALLLACSAVAQDTAAGEATEMKPIVVTGTYLESADAAGTLTVTPVELTEPINQGYSTVEDVLRTKLPQYGGPGNLNPSYGNGGDGNSYLALRGLPVNATLVLVNGRRTSTSALNLIPDAAVEKIEVLNDGGSAVYGSDAVAGVVNIILKKNFQGTKLTATYGFTTETPNVNERKFQLLAGDSTDKGNFVISAEYSASDQILSPQRYPSNQARGTSGTGNPGTIFNNTDYGSITNSLGNVVPLAIGLPWHVNPAVSRGLTNASQIPAGFNPLASVDTSSATDAAGARAIRDAEIARLNALLGPDSAVLYGNGPRFAFPAYTTLYRPHEKYDFSGSAEYKLINDTVKFFGEAYYVSYKSQFQLAPSPLTGLTIPLNNYWYTTLFPNAPTTGDLSQNYRIVELGPRVYTDQWQDFRFVGGLRGDIADTTWKWELGYLFTRGEDLQTASGGVVLSKLDALLGMGTPGAWNPFGYTPPFGQSEVNQVGALADSAYLQYIYKSQGIDFNTSGEVIDLPGGPLKLALGFNNRREAFDQIPDLATKDGLISPFNAIPPLSAVRTIWGGYGEVLVPVFGKDFNLPAFSELSLSAALRYEDYDDVGDTDILPRVSGRWKPLENEAFTIRGSYAEGFSAPGFSDLYSPPSQNFIEIFNPYTQTYEQPTDAVLELGNPGLKPTTAKTWLVGGEYSPSFIKSLTVGMDYYRIEQEGIPFSSADYTVAQWFAAGGNNNPNNPWGPTAGPSPQNPAGTQVSYNEVTGQFEQIRNQAAINAGHRFTDGIDLNLAHALETDLGTFTFSGLATRVLTFEQQDVAGAPTIDYLGRYWGSGAALSDTGYPEWRAHLTVAYNYKRVNAAIGANYTDGYTETFSGAERDVAYWLTFDARVGVTIPWIEADLLVGVNNLFDEAPSTVYSSFENNFDRSIGDPRGRMVFISLSKTF
jgi:iron complex outermembrane receptor protein